MSGFQPTPFPESRPARLQQRNGGEIVDADPEREPMAPGEKVGLVFLVIASSLVAVGCLDWIFNNWIPNLWSAL